MIGWLRKILGGGESTPSIDDVDFEALAQIIGCPVQNENLFTQALRHRSLLRGTPDAHKDSNERLEYLGDAILGFVVAEHLYRAYPDRDEGFLTRLRAKLVNGR
ncbi:MAG: ribonuclease III, partial [Bacteroidetes Order II. Incertae sedis bacterium]|nr:ribonuclease III [Bacteroidetes Order II. bacterium]